MARREKAHSFPAELRRPLETVEMIKSATITASLRPALDHPAPSSPLCDLAILFLALTASIAIRNQLYSSGDWSGLSRPCSCCFWASFRRWALRAAAVRDFVALISGLLISARSASCLEPCTSVFSVPGRVAKTYLILIVIFCPTP